MLVVLRYWKTCEKMDWQKRFQYCRVAPYSWYSEIKLRVAFKQKFLIYQFATYLALDVPSSGSSWGNIQMVTDYIFITVLL
jgi:hypothetical protein